MFLLKNIRIYHEFVDRIDKSVPRVTAWHNEALPSDAKLTQGTELPILSTNACWILFLAHFGCQRYNKSIFASKYSTFTSAILNKTDVILTYL